MHEDTSHFGADVLPLRRVTADSLARRLIGQLRERIDSLTKELVDAILAENSDYIDERLVSLDELTASCRDNIDRVLTLLLDNGSHRVGEEAPQATGARRAQQRVALDSLLRSYRLGGRLIWQHLVSIAGHDSDVDTDQLLGLATTLWTVVDAVSSEVATAYRRVERDVDLLDEELMSATLEGLLQGKGRDQEFLARAAQCLRLPANSPYLVVAVDEPREVRHSTVLRRDTLRAAGLPALWTYRPAGQLIVIAVHEWHTAGVLRILEPLIKGRAAIAPPVDGLGEIDRAYPLAAMAVRASRKPGVVQLVDILPDALLVHAPEIGELLVDSTLGNILSLLDKESEALLETLTTWLDANCSASATASRLHCHRNTVLNRLHRIETLLGYPLSGRDTLLRLSLALNALHLDTERN